MLAKLAVTSVAFWVDKPYDYLVPPELEGEIKPGMRALVPFGRGNRRVEAIVLRLGEEESSRPLKPIDRLIDKEPVLSEELLRLALWMRERFFCTVGDAIKAMLPAGLWLNAKGTRRAKDKTVRFASLRVSGEEALAFSAAKKRAAPQQAAILELLASIGEAELSDIRGFTGAGAASFRGLENAGLIAVSEREVFRRPKRAFAEAEKEPLPSLTEAQTEAFEGISALLDSREGSAALLWGVTGSGKTSVYMRLIARALEQDRSAILLVPEIALTPQMLASFSARFGDAIAVMHSSLSIGERYDEWKRVRTGAARVVIGTRSAVFAPVDRLGIIIIDEEQESTYKSEGKPRYHAREVAKYRCAKAGATLLLGSATPSVETRYSAELGRYDYFSLPERFNCGELPGVVIVDMKKELRAGNGGELSFRLQEELRRGIEAGEQSILFLNRRGYGKLLTCAECGYTFTCPRCSVNLTYHSPNRRLLCHYCGYSKLPGTDCPECGGKLLLHGAGTQRVESELKELFPGVGVLRMDTDTVAEAGSHAALLRRFREERVPIMIGTQMVTKGLDFENVTLVGVLSADQSLYIGGYRAGERTFSLITQVVGRSGRGSKPGRAVIQTFTPRNQIISLAAAQDYESFYAAEIELRRMLGAPPITDMFSLTASGADEATVVKCCAAIKRELLQRLSDRPDVSVLGPAPLFVVRVNNRYRYRVTLTCRADRDVRALIAHITGVFSTDKEYRGVTVFADADPAE